MTRKLIQFDEFLCEISPNANKNVELPDKFSKFNSLTYFPKFSEKKSPTSLKSTSVVILIYRKLEHVLKFDTNCQG